MHKIIFFFTILFFLKIATCQGQVVFPYPPKISYDADSIRYELANTSYYSYFSRSYDSFIFENKPVEYRLIEVIDKKHKAGYYIITYKGAYVERYDVRNGLIDGIGAQFLIGNGNKIRCESLFKSGRLNGVTMFYDRNGAISGILLYKRGRYIKYLYNVFSVSKKTLKKGNKLARDPFKKRW